MTGHSFSVLVTLILPSEHHEGSVCHWWCISWTTAQILSYFLRFINSKEVQEAVWQLPNRAVNTNVQKWGAGRYHRWLFVQIESQRRALTAEQKGLQEAVHFSPSLTMASPRSTSISWSLLSVITLMVIEDISPWNMTMTNMSHFQDVARLKNLVINLSERIRILESEAPSSLEAKLMNSGDIAWLLTATALVFFMTIPGSFITTFTPPMKTLKTNL